MRCCECHAAGVVDRTSVVNEVDCRLAVVFVNAYDDAASVARQHGSAGIGNLGGLRKCIIGILYEFQQYAVGLVAGLLNLPSHPIQQEPLLCGFFDSLCPGRPTPPFPH